MSFPISFPINYSLDLLITKEKEKTNYPYQKPDVRRYWPVPPLIDSVFEYQDINNDVNLRKDVTDFFHKKILKWIDEYPNFTHLKSQKKYLQSNEGKMKIYNLLRHFIKNSGINWYDLRDNYSLIKEYLSKKL
jgi:hypothetical protein